MLKRNGALESVFESLNEFVDSDVLSSYDGGSAMLGVRTAIVGTRLRAWICAWFCQLRPVLQRPWQLRNSRHSMEVTKNMREEHKPWKERGFDHCTTITLVFALVA